MSEIYDIVIIGGGPVKVTAGIYATGDVTDKIFKQNNIAAGDAIKATLSVYNYILKIKKSDLSNLSRFLFAYE